MPYIAQVALGQKPELTIFGGDYPTEDGTGSILNFFLTDIEIITVTVEFFSSLPIIIILFSKKVFNF